MERMTEAERARKVLTADMLALTGINNKRWRLALNKGHYKCAPAAVGNFRYWSTDQMVAVVWYDALRKSGVELALAAGMAGLLTEAMQREPEASEFSVWAWERNKEKGGMTIGAKPAEAPEAQKILTVPITEWRQNVANAMTVYYAKQAKEPRHARR